MAINEALWRLLFSILGAFFGAFLAILRENSRKPNLVIEPGSFGDGNYPQLGAPSRFLHLKVKNVEWPEWWKEFLLGNKPALFCKAKLEFLEPKTKTEVFSFQGRWTSAPEPLIPTGKQPNVGIFDPSKAISAEAENILPGESKEISVALKIERQDEFIGFNNWSYQWPQWRNPDWVISKGSMLLRVILWWDSGKTERCFVISNEQKTIKSFHIGNYPDEECK